MSIVRYARNVIYAELMVHMYIREMQAAGCFVLWRTRWMLEETGGGFLRTTGCSNGKFCARVCRISSFYGVCSCLPSAPLLSCTPISITIFKSGSFSVPTLNKAWHGNNLSGVKRFYSPQTRRKLKFDILCIILIQPFVNLCLSKTSASFLNAKTCFVLPEWA